MATRFPFAVLGLLAVPLLVIGSPVPRTPAKHDLRAVRSIDGAVVVVTDRAESVPEFFARAKRDGAGVFTVHSVAGRAADNRRAGAARVQFLNRQLQNSDERAEDILRNWPDASGVDFPDKRVGAILLREIEVEKGAAENLVLLARATPENKYEVIGYARTADALKGLNEEYRPQPIEHRWQIDQWQLRVNDVQQLRVQQIRVQQVRGE